MHKIQKHIEIVRSSTKALSSMSIESANALCEALGQAYAKVGITNVSTRSDLDRVAAANPDMVFLGMKKLQTLNETIWLADFFDDCDITYTGSEQVAHMLELDKSLAKQRVLSAGLKTSSYFVAVQGEDIFEADIHLSYPVFIKPTNRGGGVGIDDNSVAHNFEQLKAKVESISTKYGADSLVEEYLDGREFSVAILREPEADKFMVMPLELIAPANSQGYRMLSSAVKTADTECSIAIQEAGLRKSVSELALSAFYALGARDYGRIDIRLNSAGEPNFLEANLMPSILKDYGNFPKACMLNESISYEESMRRIVALASERSAKTDTIDIAQPILRISEAFTL